MTTRNLSGRVKAAANQNTRARDYWLNRLAGELVKTSFPYDFPGGIKKPRPSRGPMAVNAEPAAFLDFQWKDDLFARLMEVSRRSLPLLQAILTAAGAVLLGKYSGSDIVLLGIPIYKQDSEAEFVNTVFVLKQQLETGMTFKELLLEVRQNILEACENQNYPIEMLPEKLNMPMAPGDDFPLFDVAILLENIHDKEYLRHLRCNLTFAFNSKTHSLEGVAAYSPLLYREQTIARIIKHYETVLAQGLNHLDARLGTIAILSAEEKNRLLVDFNQTGRAYPRDKTIPDLFAGQVERWPHRIAAAGIEPTPTGGSEVSLHLTYRELDEKANRLARILRGEGIRRDAPVGLLVEPCPRMIIGMMGILKAGAAYLPIDPAVPTRRIEWILNDAAVPVLLSAHRGGKKIANPGKLIDLNQADLDKGVAANPAFHAQPRDLAYVIYTSGSTGVPKGVAVEHSQLVNFLYHMYRCYRKNIDGDDRCLSLTNIMFDVSVWEFFLPLLFGARVILFPGQKRSDLVALADAIHREGITLVYLPPGLLKPIAEQLKIQRRRLRLNKMLVGVEPIRDEVLEDYMRLNPQMQIINGYGPTETTICASSYNYTSHEPEGEIVPIGVPLSNNQILVLDAANHLVPPGTAGEICISGSGVSRGYLNNPESTAEKYTPHPYFKGKCLYRSGDRARLLPCGNIRFLGRSDQQVKIRGYRIEPGEIENQLLKHDEIKEAVVLVLAPTTPPHSPENPGDKYLCAYVTGKRRFSAPELREYLSHRLQEYMIPANFVQVDRFPLTPNGKLDKNALPLPGPVSGSPYAAPRNRLEKQLVEMWGESAGAGEETIGIDDRFFDRGGNSLTLSLLAAKIYQRFNCKISLAQLFEMSTVKQLSTWLETQAVGKFNPVQPVEAREYYPLSTAQRRLYFIYQMQNKNTAYNITKIVKLAGEPDRDKLEQTFKRLIRRHESLRTSFEVVHHEPVQKIHRHTDFKIEYLDPGHTGRKPDVNLIAGFLQPFDLARPPLLKVGLIKTGPERHIMVIDLHHITADGTSGRILLNEFTLLYQGEMLPPCRIQYRDFSQWQHEAREKEPLKQQDNYWLKKFEQETPGLLLATDFPRPRRQSFKGDDIDFTLNQRLSGELKRMAKTAGATLYMVLLAVLTVLLHKYTGQEDIVIGSPIEGRDYPGLKDVIGMFVGQLVMRNHPRGDKRFQDFLEEVKADALNAYSNQDYPFDELVKVLGLQGDLSRNPLFDVVFALQDIGREDNNEPGENSSKTLGNLTLMPYEYKRESSKTDLRLGAVVHRETIDMKLTYDVALFQQATAREMAKRYVEILEQVVENSGVRLANIKVHHRLRRAESTNLRNREEDFSF